MNKLFYFILFFFVIGPGHSQNGAVKVVMEEQNHRIMLYAVNESDTDYDVKVTVSGTNFRQSRARPRFIRVPAASRVFVKTIIPLRGKSPDINFDLELNDSLSGRSLIRDVEKIKLRPPKPIIIYIPPYCEGCDSLLSSMSIGKYQFTVHKLAERPEIKAQLQKVFGEVSLDSLPLPIISLKGRLYTRLENYEQVLQKMEIP